MTNRSCFAFCSIGKFAIGTNCLSIVLDYKQIMFIGNAHNCFHVSNSTEQMYWNNCFGFWRYCFSNSFDINVHIDNIDIDQNWCKLQYRNSFYCRSKCKIGSYDLIARF